MNCEHYNTFCQMFKSYKIGMKLHPEKMKHYYGSPIGNDNSKSFIGGIDDSLKEVKIFEIEDNVKKLLCMTKTPKKNIEVKIPFHNIFLDVRFTKDELKEYGVEMMSDEIIGLMVTDNIQFVLTKEEGIIKDKVEQINLRKNVEGKGLRISTITRENNEIIFHAFNKAISFEGEFSHFKIIDNNFVDPIAKEFCYRFLLNFLNFVNCPEVTFIEHKRSEKNIQKRIREGKPPIPSSIVVFLTGRIKKYVDEIHLRTETKWHYNYEFDVKGHYRFLRSPRYKVQGIIWVEPFVKGQGIHVPSVYKLKSKPTK